MDEKETTQPSAPKPSNENSGTTSEDGQSSGDLDSPVELLPRIEFRHFEEGSGSETKEGDKE